MNPNFPTTLTLIRLVFSPLFLPIILVLFLPSTSLLVHYALALIFIMLSITDFFDGYLARKHGQVTQWGTLLDPMADKFLVLSTLIALLVVGKIFYYWALVFIAREFVVLGLRIAALERNFTLPVAPIGKLKTATQCIYLTLAILNPRIQPNDALYHLETLSLYTALLLTIASTYYYYRSFCTKLEQ